jgi:hypothetical protein
MTGSIAALLTQAPPAPPPPVIDVLNRQFSIPQLLATIIGWMLLIAGAIAVIYLIWAGYQYITAAGDPEKATKAKNAIIHAVIGIIVIVLSYAILRTVMGAALNL